MILRLILSLILLTALACTKADPGFETLSSSSIPQPLFSGATVKNLTTTSASSTFTVSGECDVKIRSIEAQVIGVSGSALTDLASVAMTTPAVTCSQDGKFSFELKSLSALGYTAADNSTYEIQLRGMTNAGTSNASSLKITYTNANNNAPKRMAITAGSTASSVGSVVARQSTSTNFKAEIRVDVRGNDSGNQQSGTFFKSKFGAAMSAD